MTTNPYAIYVEQRPLRIAFLVEKQASLAIIDQILSYNRRKWGGRFNPIVLVDGDILQDNWWGFLRYCDPDVIKSTIVLSDELQRQLHTRLSPLTIEISDKKPHSSISLRYEPLSIQPTRTNLGRVSRDMFGVDSALAHFKISDKTPPAIRDFLSRNFGLLEVHELTTFTPGESPQGINSHIFEINDYQSLNDALIQLPTCAPKVVFPAQICTIPNSFKDGHNDGQHFTVIIGDSIEDIAHSWNAALSLPAWMRYNLAYLWLPTELAANKTIRSGLEKFINHCVTKISLNNDRIVQFSSVSLEQSELTDVVDAFSSQPWRSKLSQRLGQPSLSKHVAHNASLTLSRGSDMFRAHSNQEYLSLGEPDVERGTMAGEHWCADLTIQFTPQTFATISGMRHWWRLPRRNALLRDVGMFRQPARINENGIFSVLISRRTAPFEEGASLTINLPDENAIFDKLLCGERYDYFHTDEQGRFQSRVFHASRLSDQGQYLAGLLNLWPDLFNASHVFERIYWRRIFGRMSNHDLAKDSVKRGEIVNKLSKALRQGRDFKSSAEDIDWLAGRILVYARDYSRQAIDLTYSELLDEAKKETDAYNANPNGNSATLNEDEFKDVLANLVESRVLLPGIRPKCARCGYRIWYHIDDVTQELQCRGCNLRFSVAIEEKWYYRLNSLVRAAVTQHGTVPLLLALAQLMGEARSSFMFAPCTVLLKKEDGSDRYRLCQEIDLLCIKDGKFIIGEVKQSINLFDVSDFDKMEEIAKLIRPDIVLFASLDAAPNRSVTNHIERLKTRLAFLEIDVNWLQLRPWVFSPQPIT